MAAGCPARESVYVYADTPQRTKATAQALLDGFAARLRYSRIGRKADGGHGQPVLIRCRRACASSTRWSAQTRVLERVAGDLNRTTRDHKAPYDTLQTVLDCCKPALCSAFGRGESCTLPDLPTALLPQPDGKGLASDRRAGHRVGHVGILLLEYADGMPAADVAWGRATNAADAADVAAAHREPTISCSARLTSRARWVGAPVARRRGGDERAPAGLRTAGPGRARGEVRRVCRT